MIESHPESNETTALHTEVATVAENYKDGPYKLKRNHFGLLQNVDYIFDEDGHISWRAMIKPEHLYPNKESFKKGEAPDSIDGLPDSKLLIKLSGIKELARLRGFIDVNHQVNYVKDDYVIDRCVITWLPNYETNNETVAFSDVANASSENCSGFGVKFLETIAANRAFVRAVRNYLNIHIVGADEIDKSGGSAQIEENAESSISILTPQGNLEKCAASSGYLTYEEFRSEFLNPKIKDKSYAPKETPKTPWLSYKDISATECRRITLLLKKK